MRLSATSGFLLLVAERGWPFCGSWQDEALFAVDSVVLKRLISPRKRISSCESSPSISAFPVARVSCGEKIGERNVHGFGDFRQRLK